MAILYTIVWNRFKIFLALKLSQIGGNIHLKIIKILKDFVKLTDAEYQDLRAYSISYFLLILLSEIKGTSFPDVPNNMFWKGWRWL